MKTEKQGWARSIARLFFMLLLLAGGLSAGGQVSGRGQATPFPPCAKPGWFPQGFGLKDHSIFWHDGFYYLVSIYLYPDNRFAYGRSADLCAWETLAPVLATHQPGGWDEQAVWAPSVFVENGTYYLYYTGVNKSLAQSILLATTTEPDDPASWKPQAMVFQPSHAGRIWKATSWSDCRDPMVIKAGALYYLYYTGSDLTGGIIGVATASSPAGPWYDWGGVAPPAAGKILESPAVVQAGSAYYLFYNQTSTAQAREALLKAMQDGPFDPQAPVAAPDTGEYFRYSPAPGGPWNPAQAFSPGWAHEVWQAQGGAWFTSYLTNYSVSISPLTWNAYFQPARPFAGPAVHNLTLPVVFNR